MDIENNRVTHMLYYGTYGWNDIGLYIIRLSLYKALIKM